MGCTRCSVMGLAAASPSSRETRATTAAEPALLHQLHQRVGLHLEGFLEAGIAAALLVDRQLFEILGVEILGQDRHQSHQAWVLFARGRATFSAGTEATVAAFCGLAPCGAGWVRNRWMMASIRSGVRFSSN